MMKDIQNRKVVEMSRFKMLFYAVIGKGAPGSGKKCTSADELSCVPQGSIREN